MAGAYCLACVSLALIKVSTEVEWADSAIVATTGIYVMSVPLIIGAVSTAEERNLGVLESQLTLPIRIYRQWAIKGVTCFGLCLVLGMVLPALVGSGALLLSAQTANDVIFGLNVHTITKVLGGELLMLAVAMYASSVSPNSVRGLITAVGLWVVFGMLFAFLMAHGQEYVRNHSIITYNMDVYFGWVDMRELVETAGMYGLGLLVWWLAYANYRVADLRLRRLCWHGVTAVGALALWLVLKSL